MTGGRPHDADLIVVGGGPVGLAAGIEAAVLGMDVLIVEPREGPIDKACGEGLMPGALAALDRLGAHPAGHEIAGIAYLDGAREARHRFVGATGRGVRRTVLHAALAARAAEVGVRVERARVVDVDVGADSVSAGLAGEAGLSGGRVRARWMIAADGLHSPVRRMLDLERSPQRDDRRRYGIRRHYAVAPWTDLVEVHWSGDVEAYVTPVDAETVGVAMLGPRHVDLDAALAGIPTLAAHLAAAPAVTSARGAGPLLQRTSARTSGRVLLAGDASGYVDALTGEGLRVGFAQARSAVAAIVAGDASAYERAWRQETRDFRMLTSALVAAARSPLRHRIVPAAAAAPRLFGSVVDRLAR
ncbi:NAD(P)/FAD-dependent oxidoreductase [Leifsonia sp. NPDC058292]|uniref:NAD(P)/FAD-dependent oxidoreductase n=1 Tax=Leifsonia sp. NPDC058292 TaxID=3346428 RepID=UPI0036DD95A8